RARYVFGIKVIQGHAVAGKCAHADFNRRKMTILAEFRAFASQEILGRVDDVIAHARFVNFRKRPKRRRGLASFLVPVAVGPIRRLERLDELPRLNLRKIIDVRLPRQPAEVGLLPRIRLDGFLEGLVGGDPQVLAQRIVIAVDSYLAARSDETTKGIVASKIRTI